MLVLGHTGITLAAALLLYGAATFIHSPKNKLEKSTDGPLTFAPSAIIKAPPPKTRSWFVSLARYTDISLLVLASLLPDIIDKPLGHLFFREALGSGRTVGHTLFFFILFALPGAYLYRCRHRNWLSVVSFGVLMHLILDQMWQTPFTLLWPLFGFAFERQDITDWLPNIFNELFSNPGVYIPELLGGLVIVWFSREVLSRGKLFFFIRNGRV